MLKQGAAPSLHHVGYVVSSIQESLSQWSSSLCAVATSELYEDPIQKVRAVFLTLPDGQIVELIEPASPDSPVKSFLEKGGGLHHLCFEVDDLESHLSYMRNQRAAAVRRPKPAVAFNGRRIAWMLVSGSMLVEYLERSLPNSASV
jgi:methylmalonyl-CoA/ethylmalonyl-CoA epimerase